MHKINVKNEAQRISGKLVDLVVVSSVISPNSIKEIILSMYNIDSINKCELLQSNIHDTYKVSGGKQSYILKLFKYNWISLADIQYEIDALNFLKPSNVLVSSPLLSKSGHYILELNVPEGERFFYLSSYADGEELEYRNSKNAYVYGQSVARLHLASKNFRPTIYEKKLNVCAMYELAKDTLKEFLLDFPNERVFFIKFTNLLTEHIKAFNFKELEYSFCHGDLHGGNIKYCNNNGVFYDFDFCGYGLISYEIAIFKWMSMLRNNDELWHEFILGYRSKRNLSKNELRPVLVFVAIRDIWIMYLFINRVDVLGKLYISQPYIEKRMSFLKTLSNKL